MVGDIRSTKKSVHQLQSNTAPKWFALQDVEADLFDAVFVMDYDRLSRGDLEAQGKIRRILKNSVTKVITPTKVYDFNNEEAELINDIEGVFSRREYRMIRRRLNRGKKRGAKNGNWTNGKPPFPYVYNPLTKTLMLTLIS